MSFLRYGTSAVAILIGLTLTWPPSITAQSTGLRIVVLDGEDAINIVQQKTAVAPLVEVRDRNNQPVAGAVVKFAITKGRATFSGAKVLTVTTNAAGRAAATGLTPTGTGALQIGASAAFQGQTAAATIIQTNVMTAAQAAAASSASAGASGGAGAGATSGASAGAGGGGGGLSTTTLAVVGGAAAGGTVVAAKVLDDPAASGTAYIGDFSGQIVITGPPPFCGAMQTVSGTLVFRIESISASGVNGEAQLDEDISHMYAPACKLPNPQPFHDRAQAPLTGTSDHLEFTFQRTNTFTVSNGQTGIRTWSLSFTGTFTGIEIVGVLTDTEADESTSGPRITSSGTSTFPITLR